VPTPLQALPLVGLLLMGSARPVLARPDTIAVPQDAATLEEAIDRARAGDLILVDRGTYDGGVVVPEDRPGITIRGVDRNGVVFDGGDRRDDAIRVLADDVTLENMSAHNFTGNAFSWVGVDGYAARYLTVWNVEYYGLFAISSRNGVIEDSLVSGAADAAFYIGECRPCDATIRRVIAVLSSIGYSGTNASGNLVLRDSLFEQNGTGIMPNSYNEERFPPQGAMAILDNVVLGSGTVPTPNESPLGGFTGLGIAIAGGVNNRVTGNRVRDSSAFGIVLYPTVQRTGPAWAPEGNRIRGNDVSGSGGVDLAVAAGSGPGNCFSANRFASSLPADIEVVGGCPGGLGQSPFGDPKVAARLAVPPPVALERAGPRPDYRDLPAPPSQPSMPGAEPGGFTWGSALRAGLAAAGVGSVLLLGGRALWRIRARRRAAEPTGDR
jgi:hypothetical protein